VQRKLFFVYGVGCHALFLGVYAWMAAFVANIDFGVIPTIDGPRGGSLADALAIDLILIAIFGIQHSVMARPAFKRWWTRFVPQPIERSTYVLISCLLMMLLMWQWRPIGGIVWDVTHPVGRTALFGLFALGWVMVPVVSLLINHFDLFGSRQVWLHLRGREYSNLPFRVPLAYALVRHPLYVGWIVAFWATPTMTLSHLAFAALFTAYILIAIPLEERNLVEHFGQKYVEYRRRVGGLLPRLPGPRVAIDLSIVRDPTWLSWVVLIALLVMRFATGSMSPIFAAIALCLALATIDLFLRRGDFKAMSVQVWLGYAALLTVGLLPGMAWLHVVQIVGTSVRVLGGYCLLDRELRLMPWNRVEPLTPRGAWQVLTAWPRDGGIVRLEIDDAAAGISCACGFGRSSSSSTSPLTVGAEVT
jgi:protein-S-isoprenylcysteine O-methyltransferase Ste14